LELQRQDDDDPKPSLQTLSNIKIRAICTMNGDALSGRHLPGLDGVRGLAILFVMLFHMTIMEPQTGTQKALFDIMSAGWVGVELFFVLSGMLITGILLDTREHTGYFRNFYARRVLRIFPLYYALLILSFYILPYFSHPKIANFSRATGYEIWYWLFLSNFSSAMIGGPRHGIMDVTWSLAIEEQFYLVWPFLVLLLGKRRLAVAAIALFFTSFVGRAGALYFDVPPWTIYIVTPARLDGLCSGALVAIALRTFRFHDPRLIRAVWLVFLGGAAATFAIASFEKGLPWDGRLVQTAGLSALAIMFAGLVALTAVESDAGGVVDRIMRLGWLRTLGLYSYALYLFHLPLRALVRDAVLKPESFAAFPGGVLVGQAAFYFFAISICFAAAWLSYRYFERPFLGLKAIFAEGAGRKSVGGWRAPC
jgi:peptidoglycan/LPS O-acetylase OafA/YrhL